MKAKLLYLCILLSAETFSQYSNYYNVYKSVDVNQKVTVSGNITTIDYGSLASANAMRERNRLENMKIDDQRSLMIVENPMKAFEAT